jgi:hypothetical protein
MAVSVGEANGYQTWDNAEGLEETIFGLLNFFGLSWRFLQLRYPSAIQRPCYRLDVRRIVFRFPAGAGNFSFQPKRWYRLWSHPGSYSVGTEGCFLLGKTAGTWSYTAEAKNERSRTFPFLYHFMTCTKTTFLTRFLLLNVIQFWTGSYCFCIINHLYYYNVWAG